MLFDAPPVRRLRARTRECVSHYCQYKASWRERARVLSWRGDIICVPADTCEGRRGICSSTHKKPHIVLRGLHPTLHVPWTKVAKQYRKKWCEQWAHVIIHAASCSSLHRRAVRCCAWAFSGANREHQKTGCFCVTRPHVSWPQKLGNIIQMLPRFNLEFQFVGLVKASPFRVFAHTLGSSIRQFQLTACIAVRCCAWASSGCPIGLADDRTTATRTTTKATSPDSSP